MVGAAGIEPKTPRVWVQRLNHSATLFKLIVAIMCTTNKSQYLTKKNQRTIKQFALNITDIHPADICVYRCVLLVSILGTNQQNRERIRIL